MCVVYKNFFEVDVTRLCYLHVSTLSFRPPRVKFQMLQKAVYNFFENWVQ